MPQGDEVHNRTIPEKYWKNTNRLRGGSNRLPESKKVPQVTSNFRSLYSPDAYSG